ncbi:DNA polymerase III subunit chi [Pseudomonas sp.]|uniref:DNA polymerase III subunit chi n=1 Tax=Pseudomonas sp. TaxID=306 RepID=UPI0019F70629|nr:DNA polymerase III subunit chi [Pseudomonas sp.]MBF0675383.1 DNA polymerase III subunit chi [Pseudomonas sp.]
MDRKPPQRPTHLLNDLESIRDLLDDKNTEPPLLTDVLDTDTIPLLSDVVGPTQTPSASLPRTAGATPNKAPATQTASTRPAERRDNDELRAAADLVMQEVVREYMPKIEFEFKRRLRERMAHLIRTPKP